MKINQITTDAWLGKVTHYGGGGSLIIKSHPTLCDPRDCSPRGSSVHAISQAKYWSGLPFPSPGHLPDPETESASPAWQANSLLLSHL